MEQQSQPLDVLIVGAGPGGTATAFRAKELGLSALVIDYDDILKRIREYAKNKPILPSFGGGDRMQFPVGGELFARLHFEPIDKDDMVTLWKRHYEEAGIDVQTGVELLGLEPRADKAWSVRCWNHKDKAQMTLVARHVVIGIGRGVPRRFDIPGNTDGIAFRLDDAAAYVGHPALVIGGGTSAAEAVIAISNAKVQNSDPCCVFWSYRGDKMPRVSKALADVFFEAYIGNGNIRYHPQSEPTSVVLGDDRKEYLAVRMDRKQLANRPSESFHLEFRKESCVACIGEDIPEKLLASMGIFMATAGPDNARRMLLSKYLETRLPNVYLIGDLLAQAYFETDDFDADPATFREVNHKGNIKAALVDGYRVVEVIRRKLAGEPLGDIEIPYAGGEPARPGVAKPAPAVAKAVGAPAPPVLTPVESAGPPAASQLADRRVREEEALLVRVLQGEVFENEYPLRVDAVTTIGRTGCDLSFPDDSLLSERHASISPAAEGYVLRDDGSATGVYLLAPKGKPVLVPSGGIVRLGRQFLVFGSENSRPYVVHWDDQGHQKGRYPLANGETIVGREAPQLTLDPDDSTLSRQHLRVVVREGRTFIEDSSSNGSYLKVDGFVQLNHGDRFRVGQQLFAFSRVEGAVVDTGHRAAPVVAAQPAVVAAPRPAPAPPVPTPPAPAPAPQPVAKSAAAAPAPAPAAGISVTFQDLGKTFELRPGQNICQLAEENGIEIVASCHEGDCGSDPIRIVSGAENLNPMETKERDTLKGTVTEDFADVCKIVPGTHRLACVTRPKGPVVVEILRR